MNSSIREDRLTLLDDLTPDGKRALLGQILRSHSDEKATIHPLSHGQQALFFVYLTAPASTAYHMVFAARVRTAGDVSALRLACQRLVRRHAILQSRFRIRAGEVVREVLPDQEINFDHRLFEGAAWSELIYRATEASKTPFDLSNGPAVRFSVFSRSGDDHLLLVVMHHIVSDGHSLWILLDELRVLYAAEICHSTIALPEPRLTYGDYVVWQRHTLAGPTGERLWSYWQQQLCGELPILHLPYDHSRPPFQTFSGGLHSFEFDSLLTKRLRAAGRESGATLFMVLLAAFQTLLHHFSGQPDILIGSPASGRTRREFDGIVGYFVNPIALRADFSGDPKFNEHLAKTKKTVLEGLAHQDYPFPLIVQRLQPRRDPSRSPIFQAMFVSQKPPKFAGGKGGFGPGLEPVELPQRQGHFDLVLENIELADSLRWNLKYNADLFEPNTVTLLAEHFLEIAIAIANGLDEPVSKVGLTSRTITCRGVPSSHRPSDRRALSRCTHDLFEESARQYHNSIAVVDGLNQLTFGQLNARANQIAHRLRAFGVGPETIVGIFTSQGLDTVLGILGVLKAGGAYLPLDPSEPLPRLYAIVNDAQPKVILTLLRLGDQLPPSGAQIVFLDAENEILSKEPESDPGADVAPEHLAYVIYTSGTTGAPQGVPVDHRSLVNYALSVSMTLKLEPGMNFALVQPLTWDGSITVVVGSFCNGGCLHLIPREIYLDARALGTYFRTHRIDCAKFTPSHLAAMESVGPIEAIMPRRRLIFGGESPRWDWVRQLQAVRPRCLIFNHYGPTEATVGALVYPVGTHRIQTPNGLVPLGHPLENVRVYVLDQNLRVCPVGVPGEICISGIGLSRGYLNAPDLTRTKFTTVSIFNETEERIFKTGDRGRYLPDGAIEFLGRLDSQIKIRGYRVEPCEVEHILAQHPNIQNVSVLPSEKSVHGVRLIAYIVPDPTNSLRPEELRKFVANRLPSYMHPAAYIFIERLPLAANGKIDRHSLPSVENFDDRAGASEGLSPLSRTERAIAEIWEDVLDIRGIGVNENFFDLGGHSLLLIRVHSKLQDLFGSAVSIVELFEHPTVRTLAEHFHRKGPILNYSNQTLDRAKTRRSLRQAHAERTIARQEARLSGS